MASPVICIRDTAISNGQLMVKDMWPNRSQANPALDPAPQGPRYLRVPEANTQPVLTNGRFVAQDVSGLAAYLVGNVEQGGGGAVNPLFAVTVANNLVATMRAGVDLTVGDINAEFLVPFGGATIGGGLTSATVNDILQILGGATYTLPSGHEVETAGGVFVPPTTSFFSSFFNPIVEEDSSFWISLAQGDLLGLKAANYVVVYDGAGTVI